MTHHIVVIDEGAATLRTLSTIVATVGNVVVHPFSAASEALVWTATNAVDAFVLDYRVASADGFQLLRDVRADARFVLVPLIVVSAEPGRAVRLPALAAGANDFIQQPVEPQEIVLRLRSLLALHDARAQEATRVGLLEAWLQQDQQRLRRQADRFASLWRIASNADLNETDLMQAVLDQSTAALRAGQFFTSSLSWVDGDAIVVEARSYDPDVYETAQIPPLGTRMPLAETIHSIPLQTGQTHAWSDVTKDPVASRLGRVRAAACRALICTPFTANGRTYFLSYWSREEVSDPFGDDDTTYVELVAMFFAIRLTQTWQSDRVGYQQSHDALTGMRNRTQFRLDARAMYNASHSGAVAVIGMAGFRDVNEAFGQIIGDALLLEVGAALEKRALEAPHGGTIAARLAGDTFGVFFPGVATGRDAIEALVAFKDALRLPFSNGDPEGAATIPLTARFGVAWSNDPKAHVDDLIAHADTALHAAKRYDPGRIEVFEPGMDAEAAERMRLIGELATALKNDELELFYQPHIDLISRRITGAEALIRWHHPTRGTLLPDAFIPFAERNGLIGAVSSWVIDHVIAISPVFGNIVKNFRLYLNLSNLDLADLDVVVRFQRASQAGFHLGNLGVEITETAAMKDVGVAAHIVNLLREIDVAVAIDDFGRGYSSFALLRHLPVDIIKIDRSFMGDILNDPNDAAITEAVIDIGKRLGTVTLGAGIETPEEEAWLRKHGCNYAQGFLIAKPLPVDEFTAWLRTHIPAGRREPVSLVDTTSHFPRRPVM